MQRRNCVEDSSEPRVCTCQTLAVLFPHRGHSTCMVGMGFSSCSSLPITATSCLGLCSMTLALKSFALASCFLRPHLVQASIKRGWFPERILIGFSIEPHSPQNSIHIISYTNIGNQRLVLTQTKSWEERENRLLSASLLSVVLPVAYGYYLILCALLH